MKDYKIISLLFIALTSCSTKNINSESEYYRWINNDKHHLSVSKTINQVNLSVKYLPPEYLAYRELNGNSASQTKIDSLICIYKKSRSFLLTLTVEGENKDVRLGEDILYKYIVNPEEYRKRLLDLSFNMGEYIQLKTVSQSFIPVLHTFENSYGISPNRSIYLVFSPGDAATDDLFTSPSLEFVFDDQLFMTGISYFVFDKKDLDNIPHIDFWQK